MNGLLSNRARTSLRYLLVGVGLFIFPLSLHASIEITEIMYDLEGTDAGREWIEVYNTGSSSVDLSIWKLREAEVNHSLVPHTSGVIGGGGYAVIADKPLEFLKDHPSYSGVLLDSSFSLSNEGEKLALVDGGGTASNTVSYSNSQGGSGNGNSLQRNGSVLIEAQPTPGTQNSSIPFVSSQSNTEEEEVEDSETENTEEDYVRPEPHPAFIDVSVEGKRVVLAGIETEFRAGITNERGREPSVATFTWNFGDGFTASGRDVTHVYDFPGTYTLVLRSESMSLADEEVVDIEVIDPVIIISEVSEENGGYARLKNDTGLDQDISGWHLRVDAKYFTFPENTFVATGSEMIIPLSRLGYKFTKNSTISLHYPDGENIYTYKRQPPVSSQASAHSTYIPEVTEGASTAMLFRENVDEDALFLDTEGEVQAASITKAQEQDKIEEEVSNSAWYVFIGILAFSCGLLLFLPRRKKDHDKHELSADDFEIQEE